MKKLLPFALLVLYAIGTIGAIGYTLYNHAYVIAVGVIATAVLTYPEAKNMFKQLTDDKG